MSDFDEVLERLLTDERFRAAFAADPDGALRPFQLDESERDLLRAQFVTATSGDHEVEDRTSKSTMVGLLGPVLSAFGFGGGATTSGTPGGSGELPGRQTIEPASDPAGQQRLEPATAVERLGPAAHAAHDYHTRVDVNGDGQWDPHTAYERDDGGVDIVADVDNDGTVDFVGHDTNRDGLVESAEFDTDRDGTLDTRMRDDTGDGWMDRREQQR